MTHQGWNSLLQLNSDSVYWHFILTPKCNSYLAIIIPAPSLVRLRTLIRRSSKNLIFYHFLNLTFVFIPPHLIKLYAVPKILLSISILQTSTHLSIQSTNATSSMMSSRTAQARMRSSCSPKALFCSCYSTHQAVSLLWSHSFLSRLLRRLIGPYLSWTSEPCRISGK